LRQPFAWRDERLAKVKPLGIDKMAPPNGKLGRYRSDDKLMAFLKSL
jgi:hypothetical protein